MNRIYQIIWSRAKHGWVVVAETARTASLGSTSSRKALKLLALALLLGMTAEVQALPQGGSVTDGSGTITSSGNGMTITQSTPGLSINWQSFNIAAGESVTFNQPDPRALAFNQVTGSAAASQILGNLSANGQVWLVNPNGVLFGQNATVDVAGLLATTLNPQTLDSTSYRFSGNSTASIINQGRIATQQSGYVALIATKVSNQGSIATPLGTTALGGGSDIKVNFPLLSPVEFWINSSTSESLVENTATGSIQANGGLVIMSAGATYSAFKSAVNNDGILEAQSLRSLGGVVRIGKIYLRATSREGDVFIIDEHRNPTTEYGVIGLGGIVDIISQMTLGEDTPLGDLYVTAYRILNRGAQLRYSVDEPDTSDYRFLPGVPSGVQYLSGSGDLFTFSDLYAQILPSFLVDGAGRYDSRLVYRLVDQQEGIALASITNFANTTTFDIFFTVPQSRNGKDLNIVSKSLMSKWRSSHAYGVGSILQPPETIQFGGENSGNNIANSGIVGQRIQ